MVDSIKNNWLTMVVVTIFLGLLVFFSLFSKLGVSPDGIDHLDLSIKGIPRVKIIGQQTEEFPIKYVHFYSTGYGYHYIIHGVYKLLELLSFKSINEKIWVIAPFLSNRDLEIPVSKENLLFIMRLLSVLLTCLQIYILKKICDILKIENIYPIAILWLSFSIMYPFLHGNASRDVLINFLSICFVYNLLVFHHNRKILNIKWMMLILAFGPFVQLSLAAFLVTVLLAYAIIYFKFFYELLKTMAAIVFMRKGWFFPIILVVVALPTIADLSNKLINYQSIKPRCAKIFSFEECREKNATFKAYHHLKVLRAKKERIGIIEYVKKWYPGIFKRIFGIMGHQSYGTTNKITHILIAMISLLFIISSIINIKNKNRNLVLLGTISLIYFIVILFFVNRKTYMYTGVFNAALQGRYIFPVYPLLIIYAHSFFGSFIKAGYYAYIFLLFGFLTSIYYLFTASPKFETIVMVKNYF